MEIERRLVSIVTATIRSIFLCDRVTLIYRATVAINSTDWGVNVVLLDQIVSAGTREHIIGGFKVDSIHWMNISST